MLCQDNPFRGSPMNTPDTTLEIQTLGRFNITINGRAVETTWPDEAIKMLFCSLLSPLDLYFTWDRISRSMLGIPATQASRRQLEKSFIRPLTVFMIKEFGFNPLITGHEGLRIDPQHIHVDALEYYNTVLEGLRLLSLANHSAAREKFSKANTLYAGSYLPGMPGKIIENTRNDLESLYRTAVVDGIRHTAQNQVQTTQHPQARILKTA